jgi:hypothetical protein
MDMGTLVSKIDALDAKVTKVLKGIKDLQDTVEGQDSDGMTYLMGSEISSKLDEIKELLNSR